MRNIRYTGKKLKYYFKRTKPVTLGKVHLKTQKNRTQVLKSSWC